MRLLVIALLSVASVVPWIAFVHKIVDDPSWRNPLVFALSFFVTPLALWRFWRPAGSRCPEGQGLYPECRYIVTLTDDAISVQDPKGQVERVPLAHLQEVSILTTADGPFTSDLWWVLRDAHGATCTFPGGATGERAVLKRVQQLPGFDDATFITAMGSTSPARFVCWQADSAAIP